MPFPVNCDPIGSNTNAVSLAVTKGCNPDANSVWYYMQPNDISSFAAVLERVARSPISLDRQRRKGAVTNLTASPAFPMDTTMDAMAFWAPIMMYTVWKGPAAGEFGYDVSAVTATEYTVDANGALPQGTLVIARGFADTANNGVKVVGASATATSIPASGLVAETPNGGTSLHECGFEYPAADISVASTASTMVLDTAAGDFTTLPLFEGAYVYVDGFDNAEFNGFARVRDITAASLTLDNHSGVVATDAGAAQTIRIYYGLWCRNVPVNHADFDPNHITIEAGYDLPPGRSYEYATGAMVNTVALATPITDKSTLDFECVAHDVTEASLTRQPGTFVDFVANELFNTSEDIARLRIRDVDLNGVTTYFTDATINVNNNVSPKNVLGVLGAADLNYGNIEIGETMTTLFTDSVVTSALRNNVTCNLELVMQNNEGAFVLDQPEITLGNGEKSFPTNDKVEIALENEAFGSVAFGYAQSVTLFRYVPA